MSSRSPLMSGFGNDRLSQHVGRTKYNISSVEGDFTHFAMGSGRRKNDVESVFGISKSKKSELLFEFGETKSLGLNTNAAFNVLYVYTAKPAWLGSPVFRFLARTVQETWELVEPVFRFGLPANSIRDKCPYWREDSGFLTVTPHIGLQKVIKSYATGALEAAAISAQQPKPEPPPTQKQAAIWPWQKKQQAEQQAAASQHSQHHHGHGHGGHGHGHGHGHGGRSFLIEQPPKWLVRDYSVQWVMAINVAIWAFLATSGGRG